MFSDLVKSVIYAEIVEFCERIALAREKKAERKNVELRLHEASREGLSAPSAFVPKRACLSELDVLMPNAPRDLNL